MPHLATSTLLLLMLAPALRAQPSTAPAVGRLPHIEVDVRQKEVRLACEALAPEMPLEFLCVAANGPDHEAVLRTQARPSDLHAALLMLGLEPGRPVRYVEHLDKWLPPTGPSLRAEVAFQRDGQEVRLPAGRLIRNLKTKRAAPAIRFVFTGSRVMPDGLYAADGTGYVVSLVNFDLTPIDVPRLASNANETLEFERDPDAAPPAGTPVTLILRPADPIPAPATQPAEALRPSEIDMPLIQIAADGNVELDRRPVDIPHLTERLEALKEDRPLRVRISPARGVPQDVIEKVERAVRAADVDYAVVPPSPQASSVAPATADRLRQLQSQWDQRVAPHGDHLRAAAQAHQEILRSLRQEQLRLLEEADAIGALIERLDRRYQDLSTADPR